MFLLSLGSIDFVPRATFYHEMRLSEVPFVLPVSMLDTKAELMILEHPHAQDAITVLSQHTHRDNSVIARPQGAITLLRFIISFNMLVPNRHWPRSESEQPFRMLRQH